jgi:hypothetical protein
MATQDPTVPVMPRTLLTASLDSDRFAVIGYGRNGNVIGNWSNVHASRLAQATAHFLQYSHEVHVHDYSGRLMDVRTREVTA